MRIMAGGHDRGTITTALRSCPSRPFRDVDRPSDAFLDCACSQRRRREIQPGYGPTRPSRAISSGVGEFFRLLDAACSHRGLSPPSHLSCLGALKKEEASETV